MATGFYGQHPKDNPKPKVIGIRGGGRQYLFCVTYAEMEMYSLIWDDFGNTYTQKEFMQMLQDCDKIHELDCNCDGHPFTGTTWIHHLEADYIRGQKERVRSEDDTLLIATY